MMVRQGRFARVRREAWKQQMDDKVRPIDVTTVQERVYQELRDALYQGRFMPGEVLTIRALAPARCRSERRSSASSPRTR
jgi:hypothetical protein